MFPLYAKREYGNLKDVNGGSIPFNGRWVLRDHNGTYIDHDKCRNDLTYKYREYEIVFEGN